MLKSSPIGKTIFLLIIFTIISKISGFIREMVIAAYYGAGMEADAFFVAQTLPNILFAIIGASLTLIFIPMFIENSIKESQKKADEFASSIISIVFLVSLVLAFLGHMAAPYIVKIIAPGFQGEAFSLTTHLTRIMFPMIIFITLSDISAGILQSREHFIVPSLLNTPSNIMIILGTIFLSSHYGIVAIAWITLLATIFKVLLQMPILKKKFKFTWKINFRDRSLKEFRLLLIPVVVGTAAREVNVVVDKILASGLSEGSISAISYADRLIGLGIGIFTMSIAVVIYPLLSRATAHGNYDYLKDVIKRSIIYIHMILLPFTIAICILKQEIVGAVFSRGAFDEVAMGLTSYALAFYILGVIPFSIREILVRGFFSLQDTKTPMVNSIISAIINIILNIILITPLGIGGLGLATSLTGVISISMLFYKMKRKVGSIRERNFAMDMIKITISSIIMGIVVLAHKNLLPSTSPYINLLLISLLGLGTYFLSIVLMEVKEFTKVIENIKGLITSVVDIGRKI